MDPVRDFRAAWTPDGRALWMVFRDAAGAQVATARFDAASGRLEPPQIAATLPALTGLVDAAFAFAGPTPTLVIAATVPGDDDIELYQVRFAPGGRPRAASLHRLTDNGTLDDALALSPDGRILVWRGEASPQGGGALLAWMPLEPHARAAPDVRPDAHVFSRGNAHPFTPVATWLLLP
jgi:hypothetical protein